MDSWTRVYLGSLLLVLTIIGVVPAQDETLGTLTTSDLDLSDVVVDVEASVDPLSADAGAKDEVRVVRIKQDGTLQGRVSIIQATGKRLPADAQVKIAQAGKVVGETKTNADGEFEFAGVEPGSYEATATIEAGSTDFSVNVLPYDENAAPDQMLLDATLTPTPELLPEATCVGCGAKIDSAVDGYVDGGVVAGDLYCDGCLAEEVIIDEGYVAAPCAMGATCCSSGGFAGGGCCGGGGGLGWLLGAGGLATGITALALNDDDDRLPASPAGP